MVIQKPKDPHWGCQFDSTKVIYNTNTSKATLQTSIYNTFDLPINVQQ